MYSLGLTQEQCAECGQLKCPSTLASVGVAIIAFFIGIAAGMTVR